jgi:predicted RNase H-like HicB family nuclease
MRSREYRTQHANRFEFSSLFTDSSRVMRFAVEIEKEKDGRWIAEIPQIPGAMAYGRTRAQAVSRVKALALRVLAERIEHGETSPLIEQVFSVAAA